MYGVHSELTTCKAVTKGTLMVWEKQLPTHKYTMTPMRASGLSTEQIRDVEKVIDSPTFIRVPFPLQERVNYEDESNKTSEKQPNSSVYWISRASVGHFVMLYKNIYTTTTRHSPMKKNPFGHSPSSWDAKSGDESGPACSREQRGSYHGGAAPLDNCNWTKRIAGRRI